MRYPTNKTATQKRHSGWLVFLVFVLIVGALLLHYFGDRFVFYYAEAYANVALWSLLVFTPLVLYRMRRAPLFFRKISEKYPTAWLRNLIVMPLMAMSIVGLVCAAPLGWLFAAATWSGGAIQHVSAVASKVGPYSQRKGCNQSATLRFASAEKETCIDTLYPHASMRSGQTLDVGIRTFPFGFLIVSVAPLKNDPTT